MFAGCAPSIKRQSYSYLFDMCQVGYMMVASMLQRSCLSFVFV